LLPLGGSLVSSSSLHTQPSKTRNFYLFYFLKKQLIPISIQSLAAFLTVSRLDSPVNSLDDLSTQYKVQYAPQNGTDVATYFERMAYIEKRFYE
jgi:hypothetical protein